MINAGIPTLDEVKRLLGMSASERERHIALWNDPANRKHCRGQNFVDMFLETSGAKPGETIFDWGCGTGRAGRDLSEKGYDVTLVDFAPNCLDEEVRDGLCETLKFYEHDVLEKPEYESEYGLCVGLLDNIPQEDVNDALFNILSASRKVLFSIGITERNNITLKDYNFWLRKFTDLGCIVLRSNELAHEVIFYVTGHEHFHWNRVLMNNNVANIKEHLRENAKSGLPQVQPHIKQDQEIMLLCGGPSLDDYTDEIIANRKAGMPLVTTNGTYQWALDHGITPSMQVVIDSREFNARFVDPIVDGCKYVAATQCHPSLVNRLPKDRSFLLQVNTEKEFDSFITEHYGEMYKDWHPVPGGSTVTLRTLCLLQLLGYRYIHIYGFDSCLRDEQHHAYKQRENDNKKVVSMRVGKGTAWERKFQCHDWMAVQAREFLDLTRVYFKHLHLDVKGNGLIAHLIRTGADLPLQED